MSTSVAASARRNGIKFYFDVVSPWSFFAWEILKRYQKVWDADLEVKPMNLGYIMKFSTNRPPIAVPNKGKYMWEDQARNEVFFGVPLKKPANFPINTSPLQCHLRHVSMTQPKLLVPLLDVYFRAIWHHDAKCKTVDDVLAILDKDPSAKSFWPSEEEKRQSVEKGLAEPMKKQLMDEAEVLVKEGGVFGSPWMIVTRAKDGKEANFFGSDRFELMATFLEKPWKGPFPDGRKVKL